jgi:predicted secreted protein
VQGLSGGSSNWIRKTSNYTAVGGDRIIADTSGGGFTITLPASPSTGDFVTFTDGADWGANNLTVARNGSTIEGISDDVFLDIGKTTFDFIYDSTTWEVVAAVGQQGAPWGLKVVNYSDAASITINADTTELATQTNTQALGTLTINAPTGTLSNGQKLMVRLQSTNVQTFSWNAIFAGSTDLTLPSVSSGSSKYDYMGFIYNSTATKWQLIATVFGF